MEMKSVLVDADLEDPNPDVGELFRHYNRLYFRGALDGFTVRWSLSTTTSSTGACTFGKVGNVITLSKPMLKYRSTADLKNTLLHEMIHAVLFVKQKKRDHRSHGPSFCAWMDAINTCSMIDHQRPSGGYNITTHHDFRQEVAHIAGLQWKKFFQCESCGDLLVRPANQGPPSNGCCIENVGNDIACGNMLCHWHSHKISCGGNYARTSEPPESLGHKTVAKGAQKHPGGMSKKSELHKAKQEPGSAGLQEKAHMKKPDPVSKLPSLVGGSNAKSLSISLKEGQRQKAEGIQLNTTTQPDVATRKKEQAGSVASEKQDRSYYTRRYAKRNDWVVASAWLNYYESEGPDESIEPLINKRTKRRKFDKNQLTYAMTRKRRTKARSSSNSAHSSDSRGNAFVRRKNVRAQAPQEESPEHCQPPASCLNIIVADTLDLAAPRQSAGPSCLVTSNQIVGFTAICISDDD